MSLYRCCTARFGGQKECLKPAFKWLEALGYIEQVPVEGFEEQCSQVFLDIPPPARQAV
ncbi:MAG TPA: hypothetical protein VF043_20130 [Ktedonobacteraceae bacterium]